MKTYQSIILSALFLLLGLTSCQKEPSIETFKVLEEQMTIGTTTVNVTGAYSFEGSINGIKMWMSDDESYLDKELFPCRLNGKDFSVEATGLKPGTTYYYCYSIDYGAKEEYQTERKTITTFDYSLPVVTTAMVSEVGHDSAICGGEVTDDGGSEVTARGLCWGQQPNPSLSDHHSVDSCGTGPFTHLITGLKPDTKYYVKAYATNEKGVSFGNERVFTTASMKPTVKTVEVTDIDMVSAVVKCEVTSEGGSAISERGVCWSRHPEPTLNDASLAGGEGLGPYVCGLVGLDANTMYYVRAYATNDYNTYYGNELSFTTLKQMGPPPGAVVGLFSVGESQQVWFAQGNLQYQASTNTWRFADHQYVALGNKNESVSPTYNGWIDLFGWGTSGYDQGAVCYQPWSISNDYSNYFAYGQNTCHLYDQTGQADWGYNPISNGGDVAHIWRTLTYDEWGYVFKIRNTTSGFRYAKANVNEMNGVILLPDDWNPATFTLFSVDVEGADFSANTLTASQWVTLEEAGAVFLPAAGGRDRTECNGLGSHGCYWSASSCFDVGAMSVNFLSNYLETDYVYPRYMGLSVRLACDN